LEFTTQLQGYRMQRTNWNEESQHVPSSGTMSNLEVRHKEFRSHFGDDSEDKSSQEC
jgi:hypothetical protein